MCGVIDLGGSLDPYQNCNFRIVIDIIEPIIRDNINTIFIQQDLLKPLSATAIEHLQEHSHQIMGINISRLLRQFCDSINNMFKDSFDFECIRQEYIDNIIQFVNNVETITNICPNVNYIRILDDLVSISIFLEEFLHRNSDFNIIKFRLMEYNLHDNQLGDFEIILQRKRDTQNIRNDKTII